MELLNRYQKDIETDLKIDDINIREVSMRVPSRKHFWIGKLINHKLNLINLESDKNKIIERVMAEVQNQAPVVLSNSVLERKANDTDVIRELNLKIQQEKLIVEFLEKMEKVFSSLTYDVKNIVEVMKLEQL